MFYYCLTVSCVYNISGQRKYDFGYIRNAFKLMNLPVYNGTIFSSFFTDQNLTPILNKNQLGYVSKIPLDNGLFSDPATEVNGNDP